MIFSMIVNLSLPTVSASPEERRLIDVHLLAARNPFIH